MNNPIGGDALKYVMSLLITGSLLVLLLISCNDSVSITASYIQILSKKTGTQRTYELEVKNPYDNDAITFTMTIPEENLWNLIQVDQIYFATYEYTDINKKVELVSIKYPSENVPRK